MKTDVNNVNRNHSMKRECYLCHKIIEDETLAKCPSCQGEVLFPIKETESIPKSTEESVEKIVIGDLPNKKKRDIKLPDIFSKLKNLRKDNPIPITQSYPKNTDTESFNLINKRLEEINYKISNIPNNKNTEVETLQNRFDYLERLLSNLPQIKTSDNIIDIEEIIEHQKTIQIFVIILIIMMFLLIIVSLI